MNIKLSPTPWIAEKSRGLVGPACVTAPINGGSARLILAQGSWTDCNLIAAAPELLAALEEVVRIGDNLVSGVPLKNRIADMQAAARAALAKAKTIPAEVQS